MKEFGTRKMIEHYKQSLIGHPNRSLKDNSAENIVDVGSQVRAFRRGQILAAGLETSLRCLGKECHCFLSSPQELA